MAPHSVTQLDTSVGLAGNAVRVGSVMQGALPNLHAALVHFPIGLLTAAVIADLAAVTQSKKEPLRPAVTALHILGTLSLIAAYIAGRSAASTVFTPGMAHGIVYEHWTLALGVTIYFVLLTVLRLTAGWVITKKRWTLWAVLMIGGVIGLFWLILTADHGGQLVYRWGVGVAGP